jgi:serine O-acetyltransferase
MRALWRDFVSDVARTYQRKPRFWAVVASPLVCAGLRAMLCYRLAHACRRTRATRFLASLLKRVGLVTTGAEINPAAHIGGGIHLPHPIGIVIAASVIIEGECTIFHHVSLGPRRARGDSDDGPTIGTQVWIHPGAKIFGKLRIGSYTKIGPNCVVFTDVPGGSRVMPPEPTIEQGKYGAPGSPSAEAASEEGTRREVVR